MSEVPSQNPNTVQKFSLNFQTQGFAWDRVRVLITAYEANPNLYMTNHPDYKLEIKRSDALNNIKCSLFENGYDVSVEEINKKIHNLRTQFLKEYGKVKKDFVSGAGTADLYIPKIWWYDLLKFSINSDPVRPSRSNLPSNFQPEEITNSSTSSEDLNVTKPSSSTYRPEYRPPSNVNAEDAENVVYEGTLDELEEGIYIPSLDTPASKRRKQSGDTIAIEEETKSLFRNPFNALSCISQNANNSCDTFKAFSKWDSRYSLFAVLFSPSDPNDII